MTLPNGVTSRYDYDGLGRLRSLEHKQQEELLSSFVYAYNPAGSRIQAIESVFTFEEESLPTYLPLVCGECGELDAYPAPPESGQNEVDGFRADQNAYPAPGEEGFDTLAPDSGGMDGGDSSGYPAPEQTPEPETSTGIWDQLVQFFRALFQTPSASASAPVMASIDEATWLSDPALLAQASAASATQPMMTGGLETVQIDYDYDPLYRLTSAVYSNGTSFDYTYDAAGNRLSETISGGVTTTYEYDVANRLTSVNGVTYTWDKNGNLLSDGVSTYAYDRANRLTSVTGAGMTASYQYNGLGDRVRETVNDVTTHFTLDLNTGLTQVLAAQSAEDGTNTYLYGSSRIGQFTTSDSAYFLGDALGSVRQLTDVDGAVTMSKSYEPYGEVLRSTGNGNSAYGYTGEWHDSYSNLIFLRARYYEVSQGIFLSKDVWKGDYYSPQSMNHWTYTENNPINYIDPSGMKRKMGWLAFQRLHPQFELGVSRRVGTSILITEKEMRIIEENFEGYPSDMQCYPSLIKEKVGGKLGYMDGGKFHNYNAYDRWISGWVDYWSYRARLEGHQISVDPNLIKALAFYETWLGYNPTEYMTDDGSKGKGNTIIYVDNLAVSMLRGKLIISKGGRDVEITDPVEVKKYRKRNGLTWGLVNIPYNQTFNREDKNVEIGAFVRYMYSRYSAARYALGESATQKSLWYKAIGSFKQQGVDPNYQDNVWSLYSTGRYSTTWNGTTIYREVWYQDPGLIQPR